MVDFMLGILYHNKSQKKQEKQKITQHSYTFDWHSGHSAPLCKTTTSHEFFIDLHMHRFGETPPTAGRSSEERQVHLTNDTSLCN